MSLVPERKMNNLHAVRGDSSEGLGVGILYQGTAVLMC